MKSPRVAVIGAGIGGLASALLLAARGIDVVLLERAVQPGGKLRQLTVGGQAIDAGPTVFTLKRVFESLFDAAGSSLSAHLKLQPLKVLARHAWDEQARLDLFADRQQSIDAIGHFAGAREAAGFASFTQRAKRIWQTLEQPFVHAPAPSLPGLFAAAGLRGLPALAQVTPFSTLWSALGEHFRDPRLRQLFGRYATYCGGSPFESPATLMLVAHVEQEGVWQIEGGMHQLAQALAQLATKHGAQLRYGCHVQEILLRNGRVEGVRFSHDDRSETLQADAVICNADVGALAQGELGAALAAPFSATRRAPRSLSALTWAMTAQCEGFELARHSVFFSYDYAAEFNQLRQQRLPREPTVYVCAQDCGDPAQLVDNAIHQPADESAPTGDRTQAPEAATTPLNASACLSTAERIFIIVNAPAIASSGANRVSSLSAQEIDACETQMMQVLRRCGLRLNPQQQQRVTPQDYAQLFPASGGALYGMAPHGWQASFQRPAIRSPIKGLYLAGGSVHPGPGLPMAALSGRMAAECVLADWHLINRSHPVAMPGGMSMR